MKSRCQRKTDSAYNNYGGRGIKVCKKWQTFEGFFEDMGLCPEGYSIERIDNDGDYKKSNCKWIPRLDQNLNRRDRKTKSGYKSVYELPSGKFATYHVVRRKHVHIGTFNTAKEANTARLKHLETLSQITGGEK